MNPHGEVTIVLDRPRTIRMKYKTIALAEGQLGRPFPSLNLSSLGVREYAALLWASLVHDDPSLTLDDMYAFMDEHGLAYISAKLIEAIASAWPKDGDGDPKGGQSG